MAKLLILYRASEKVVRVAEELRKAGHNVALIHEPDDAFVEIQKNRPDVLIVGFRFPHRMSGDCFLSSLPGIPAIRISLFVDRSAYDMEGREVKCLYDIESIQGAVARLTRDKTDPVQEKKGEAAPDLRASFF